MTFTNGQLLSLDRLYGTTDLDEINEAATIRYEGLLDITYANPDMLMESGCWYGKAGDLAERCRQISRQNPLMSPWGDATFDGWACAIAHLSPRLSWQRNIEAAEMLAHNLGKPSWVFQASWDNAKSALHVSTVAGDPFSTFSARAIKTHSFARSIAGHDGYPTIDTHMIHGSLDWQPFYHDLTSTDFAACTKVLGPIVISLAKKRKVLNVPATQAAIWLPFKSEKTRKGFSGA